MFLFLVWHPPQKVGKRWVSLVLLLSASAVNNVRVWAQAISRPQQFSTLVVEEVVPAGCKGYSKMLYPLSGALKLT